MSIFFVFLLFFCADFVVIMLCDCWKLCEGTCGNEVAMKCVAVEWRVVMRILKLAKYRLNVQVEKDECPSGEGQSPRVEKDEGLETETLPRQLIVAEGPD